MSRTKNNKKAQQKLDKNHILQFTQKNYTWLAAVIAALGTIAISVLKFIKHIIAVAKLSYYDINIDLYKTDEASIVYMICATVITIIILFSMIYCFDRLCHQKNKTASNTIYYIISILVSNIYLTNNYLKT